MSLGLGRAGSYGRRLQRGRRHYSTVGRGKQQRRGYGARRLSGQRVMQLASGARRSLDGPCKHQGSYIQYSTYAVDPPANGVSAAGAWSGVPPPPTRTASCSPRWAVMCGCDQQHGLDKLPFVLSLGTSSKHAWPAPRVVHCCGLGSDVCIRYIL